MKTILDQCRIEAMDIVADAISSAIAEAKQMHGASDPELSRYLAAALVDALIEETEDNKDLLNRSVEILALHGSE